MEVQSSLQLPRIETVVNFKSFDMIRSQVLRLTNIYNNNYVLPAYNIVVNKTKLLEKVLIEHLSSILIL